MRASVAAALTNSASARLVEADTLMAKVNERRPAGDISNGFLVSTMREVYQAKQEVETHQAERDMAARQLNGLSDALQVAKAALDDVRQVYAEGRIAALSDGLIGPTVASPGAVLRMGDPLTEMYVGEQFALAYLETGTLYTVRVGDRVTIADGFHATYGTVQDILPVTLQLPPEFQKSFRATSRGQVAKIKMDNSADFPMWTKLHISGSRLTDLAMVQTLRFWFTGGSSRPSSVLPRG